MKRMVTRAVVVMTFALCAGTASAASMNFGNHGFPTVDDIFPYRAQELQCTTPRIVKHMTKQEKADCRYLLKHGVPKYLDY
jgi:hypothetical protein